MSAEKPTPSPEIIFEEPQYEVGHDSEGHPGRRENEDLFFVSEGFFAVCDGLGGHAAGRDMAEATISNLIELLAAIPPDLTLQHTRERVKDAFLQANKRLLHKKRQMINQKQQREYLSPDDRKNIELAGTTAVACYIWEGPSGEQVAIFASSGDSRGYLFRDPILYGMTLDHGPSAEKYGVLEAEKIQTALDSVKTADDLRALSPAAQQAYRERNVVKQYIGSSDVPEVLISDREIQEGDLILLCSDGISDNLTTEEIQETLSEDISPAAMAQGFVKKADSRARQRTIRSKFDDRTAVIVKVGKPQLKSKEEKAKEISPAKEIVLQEFTIGEKVKIQRTSGEIEENWMVALYFPDLDRYNVLSPDGKISKGISQEKLKRLNNR